MDRVCTDDRETGFDVASPWHAGEIALQAHAGVAERMALTGPRVIRDHLIAQHREFFGALTYVVLGAVDAGGDVWATLRAGPPGFLSSDDDGQSLHVALARNAYDPAEAGMDDGAAVGLLGIDLLTRRRNRLNGRVSRATAAGFDLLVAQSFGNCPRYIQVRHPEFTRDPSRPSSAAPIALAALEGAAKHLVATADTFFVASYVDTGPSRQIDVSHRGGERGFIRLDPDGALTIPDFAGNLFFNTLGNLLVNPRAGLAFVDFASGDLLQMTGEAKVMLDSSEVAAFTGAERLWRFTPGKILVRKGALPLRWHDEQHGASTEARVMASKPASDPEQGRWHRNDEKA